MQGLKRKKKNYHHQGISNANEYRESVHETARALRQNNNNSTAKHPHYSSGGKVGL